MMLNTGESLQTMYHAVDQSFWVLLSSFIYELDAVAHIQTFPISQQARKLNGSFTHFIFEIRSNWGSSQYTCLYRVRVHGDEAESAYIL
jgi:SUN domain-containing protein 1/2